MVFGASLPGRNERIVNLFATYPYPPETLVTLAALAGAQI